MLRLSTIDVAIIVTYLVVMLTVGVLSTKRAARGIDSYFLGGRKLPWWMLGISGMVSNLDLTGTMVITSFLFLAGMKGFLVELRGGVALSLAFLIVFMGKWLRRSKVMTNAEWMEFRFGSGRAGRAARLTMALASIVLATSMIAYFTVGVGKFLSMFLPFSPNICALMLILVASIYTITAGLYGVTFTDLLQAGVVIFAAGYISILAFTMVDIGTIANIPPGWQSIIPPWHMDMPPGYEMYEMLQLCVLFWIAKAVLEGLGGPAGVYMPQRFYAAKSDRECGLLSLLWTVLLTLRWPMMIGIAALGLTISGSITEPEMALPAVIEHYVPAGIRALVIVALIAGAMSTFDSTVNSGASYMVKDLFQGFIKPTASSRELIRLSYLASALIVIVGMTIGFTLPSINAIWSWITMGLFAGLAIPMFLRWYWWRFNGWGFTAGIAAGVLVSIFQRLFLPSWPIYYSFGIIVLASLTALLIATFLTSPTEKSTLTNFYRHTRPFGAWGMIRNGVGPGLLKGIKSENRRDFSNLFLAIPWQICLFLTPMYLVVHDFLPGIICLILLALLSVVLYFRWYRVLPRSSED